mmetsp:Transcript_105543/g.193617  ORF Transcript_105543/g.193617 Transcript_105543/m.193617 type:complete len:312 (-) Transcript_105543:57-992(-)
MEIMNDPAATPQITCHATSVCRDDDTHRSPRFSGDLQSSESDSSTSSSPARLRRSCFACARAGDMEGLKFLLASTAVSTDEHGRTPLMYAVSFGHKEIVASILGQPCVDVNAKDKRGKTALHHVCNRGRKMATNVAAEIVGLLLQAAASLEVRDCHGQTPLHLAADSGVQAVVLTLLDAGANVNSVDVSGWTPLDHSCFRQTRRGVSEMLEAHGGEGLEDKLGEEADLVVSLVIHGQEGKSLCFGCYSIGGSELGSLSVDSCCQLVGGLRMKVSQLIGAPLQRVKLLLPDGQLLSRSNNGTVLADFNLCSC